MILLDVTCEFFTEEIKKVAIVEKVLGHGWVDCDSPQRSQSLHQLVEHVEICLSIHYLQRVEEVVLLYLFAFSARNCRTDEPSSPTVAFPTELDLTA